MKTRRTRRGGVRVVYARVVVQRPSACWSRAGDEISHAAGSSTVTVTRARTRRRRVPDTVIPAMPITARRSREPIASGHSGDLVVAAWCVGSGTAVARRLIQGASGVDRRRILNASWTHTGRILTFDGFVTCAP